MRDTMIKKKSDHSTILLFLLGIALIAIALAMLVPNLLNYKKSNDTYEALKETYVSQNERISARVFKYLAR